MREKSAPRVRNFHRAMTVQEVQRLMSRSFKTAALPVAWLPVVARAAGGTSQMALLLSIHVHVETNFWRSPASKQKPKRGWTEPLTGEDFAKECGFSAQCMRTAVNDALARGLIKRRGEIGGDRCCYQLRPHAWAKIAAARPPRNSRSTFGRHSEAAA